MAADFLLFFAVPDAATASSFRLSLASFFVPFCRRASSRLIFLLSFLRFTWDHDPVILYAVHRQLSYSSLQDS
jgi:hypothetical protein